MGKTTWTMYEDNFVRENFGKLTYKEIAKELHKSPSAVRCRFNVLELKRDFSPKMLERFNRLLVIENLGLKPEPNGRMITHVKVRCDCGTEKELAYIYVKTGKTRSCGCILEEYHTNKSLQDRSNFVSNTKLYRTYHRMKQRCYNKNNGYYKHYGGRGISICKAWLDSYEKFREWANQNGYKEDLSIERIDVNGNYCPENCTWIPMRKQAQNKQNTIKITAFGETKVASEWEKDDRFSIKASTLDGRIRKGADPEEAILQPIKSTENHNLSKHPLYVLWSNIKSKCNNDKNPDYKYHGGKGIKICEEWKNSFRVFYTWSIANGWNVNTKLTRININLDFEPNNCKFEKHYISMTSENLSEEDINFLTNNIDKLSIDELAQQLGRTRKYLMRKTIQLGLRQKKNKIFH